MGVVRVHKPRRLERIGVIAQDGPDDSGDWTIWQYMRRTKEWAWFVKAANGEKLANGEGYKRHIDMMDILVRMFPMTRWVRTSFDLD